MSSHTFLKKLLQLAKHTSEMPINPEDTEEFIVDDSVAFEMERSDDPSWVHFVSIRAVNAGKGDGSGALPKVMKLADECSVYLVGKVIPYDTKVIPKHKLQSWYREHGCLPIDEEKPDGLWIRVPENKPHKLPKLSISEKIKVYKGMSQEDYKEKSRLTAAIGFLFALWLIKRN